MINWHTLNSNWNTSTMNFNPYKQFFKNRFICKGQSDLKCSYSSCVIFSNDQLFFVTDVVYDWNSLYLKLPGTENRQSEYQLKIIKWYFVFKEEIDPFAIAYIIKISWQKSLVMHTLLLISQLLNWTLFFKKLRMCLIDFVVIHSRYWWNYYIFLSICG